MARKILTETFSANGQEDGAIRTYTYQTDKTKATPKTLPSGTSGTTKPKGGSTTGDKG